jgi:hypothetical protein
VQGLVGGIPYNELGKTTLVKTQLSYLAALHRIELEARVHVDLKMTEVSGTELAKAERKKESKEEASLTEEEKDDLAHREADETRGLELGANYRLSLDFKTWAPHRQAAYVRRYGWPGEAPVSRAAPYEGVTPEVAKGLLRLVKAGKIDERFTRFWEQVSVEFEDRLGATVNRSS